MIYVDTSALVRLLDSNHDSSQRISEYFDTHSMWDRIVLSNLNALECERIAVREHLSGNRQLAAQLRSAVAELWDGVPRVATIDDRVVRRAQLIGCHVKSLDALHLGLAIGMAAHTIVTYDTQMSAAARWLSASVAWPDVELTVVAP
ncbi:type II toxin-antitoxin system VapC family toxin [Leucobacter sp. G161]|uniref:type II toxin-antitoxin system VapC family toxin n=1 Tax=Leucobacter sp. G161 TaxID=663704 RepID=UPI00073CBDE5|nr:type II toxin-antitoxin system VapC family toxin [Leucobacter sp. G161]KUF07663.1 hypothetical protein AUL38_07360 [Leucobacter sp. G161]